MGENYELGGITFVSEFNPSNLHVTYLPFVSEYKPVTGRKYTLTHSDETGQLFLRVGYEYDLSSINLKNRDEVLAEWTPQMGHYVLQGKVYITGGEYNEQSSKVRLMIFQRELPLALKAITYGDQAFYQSHPYLLDAPIYIQFQSTLHHFHQMIYIGTPRQYLFYG